MSPAVVDGMVCAAPHRTMTTSLGHNAPGNIVERRENEPEMGWMEGEAERGREQLLLSQLPLFHLNPPLLVFVLVLLS